MIVIEWRAPKSAVTGEYGKWELAHHYAYETIELAERGIKRLQSTFYAMEYRLASLTVISEK